MNWTELAMKLGRIALPPQHNYLFPHRITIQDSEGRRTYDLRRGSLVDEDTSHTSTTPQIRINTWSFREPTEPTAVRLEGQEEEISPGDMAEPWQGSHPRHPRYGGFGHARDGKRIPQHRYPFAGGPGLRTSTRFVGGTYRRANFR